MEQINEDFQSVVSTIPKEYETENNLKIRMLKKYKLNGIDPTGLQIQWMNI